MRNKRENKQLTGIRWLQKCVWSLLDELSAEFLGEGHHSP